jgi:hypothetical protein
MFMICIVRMLKNKRLREVSGICRSVLHPGIYWVHNDSGNSPIFFATNEKGADIATFRLNIKSVDTEDCSSGMINGVPTLIIGDFGDNGCKRGIYRIFVFTEPSDLTVTTPLEPRVISYKYPDGKSRNCEACALMPDGTITVVTKSYPPESGQTTRYTIRSWLSGHDKTIVTEVCKYPKNYYVITAMDSMNGKDILLGGGYVQILNPKYSRVKCEPSPQPESLCWSHDGTKFLVASERNRQLILINAPITIATTVDKDLETTNASDDIDE